MVSYPNTSLHQEGELAKGPKPQDASPESLVLSEGDTPHFLNFGYRVALGLLQ